MPYWDESYDSDEDQLDETDDESSDEDLDMNTSQIIKICQQGEKLAEECQNMVTEINNSQINKVAKRRKEKESKKNQRRLGNQTARGTTVEKGQAVLGNEAQAQ